MQRSALRSAFWLAILATSPLDVHAAGPAELLPNERAFAVTARANDARTIELHFTIAPGYYLYRDKLRLDVETGVLAAPASLPSGQIKRDQYFARMEIYRGELVATLSLKDPAPGKTLTVVAESQGCADIGVCYPPQRQKIAVIMRGAGTPVIR